MDGDVSVVLQVNVSSDYTQNVIDFFKWTVDTSNELFGKHPSPEFMYVV